MSLFLLACLFSFFSINNSSANELMRLRGKFAIHVNVAAMIVGFFGYVGASKFGKHYHLESSDEPLMRPDSVWKK
jgi:hypothetical protein